MKNVLLFVHDDDGQEARFQAAVDVTRALGGHLSCVHVTEYVPLIGADAYGMSGAVAILDAQKEVEAENRAVVEKRLAGEGVQWDFVEMTGALDAAIEEASDLADLIVLNAQMAKRWQPQVYKLVEQLVVKTPRPILAVADEEGFRPADPVLIAWDGSDPASAALRASVPLVRLSESVTIYEVVCDSGERNADLAAEYLSRHGIHAQIVRERAQDLDFVEPMLLSRLEKGAFGWAVMGAFSKSRLREGLFGGTTKWMLKESPVPLFIAH